MMKRIINHKYFPFSFWWNLKEDSYNNTKAFINGFVSTAYVIIIITIIETFLY
jgi:hypothetical protein